MKKFGLIFLSLILISGCVSKSPADSTDQAGDSLASSTPYGKYDETVTYTLANESSVNNSNMPDGDTYENNAYTRYLKEYLNIQNIDVFENSGTNYDNGINLMISQNNLPDVFMISSQEQLQYLVEHDMIADLTDCYQDCTTSTIKEIYSSYNSDVIGSVTIDDKIWALPGLNIDDGPNLLWLRSDWLEELGLDEPSSIYDIEDIVSEFISNDPDNNGVDDTVGLVLSKDIAGENGASAKYLMDIYFAAFNSFPKQWLIDDDSNLTYGSLTQSTKEALAYLADLYQRNIIDQDFMLRDDSNIYNLIVNGQCGCFFGPWWSPNNPLVDAVTIDPDATWTPYLISTDNNVTTYHSTNPVDKYIVVSKDFDHPEIIFKMASVIFDYTRYETDDATEINDYFSLNVDPTARPIAINIDYQDALVKTTSNIIRAINSNDIFELTTLEQSYMTSITRYLNGSTSPLDWAVYTSRISAIELFDQDKLVQISSVYSGNYGPCETIKADLDQYEQDAFIQIISGYKDIDYFDEFVQTYLENGGQDIIDYVENQLD